jgi:hypothetical protein
MHLPTRSRARRIAPLALLLATPAFAASTQASEEAPTSYLGAQLGLTQVSNIYRASSDPAVATAPRSNDTVTSLSLLGGLNQRLGRQHLVVDASLQQNNYANSRGLNNSGYNLRSALDWQSLANLTGTLSAALGRQLADYNIGQGATAFTGRNIETDREFAALVRLGSASSRYGMELGSKYLKRDFSAAAYDAFVFHQNENSLAAYAQPGADLRLGVAARRTNGQSPRYPWILGISLPNDYHRNDADLTARWETQRGNSLTARVSRSRTSNTLYTVNDFHGTTGSLNGSWQATPRLSFSLTAARDTGQETSLRSTDVNRVYRAIEFSGVYALSNKFSLNAAVSQGRSHALSAIDNGVTNDADHNYSLGMRWVYSRSLVLGCRAGYTSRDSSLAIYTYNASSTGCYVQGFVF